VIPAGVDDLDFGYLMAVAGALVWSPRPLRSWLRALRDPRALADWARRNPGRPPEGAEPLSPDAIERLAAVDDESARRSLDELTRSGARALTDADEEYPPRLFDLCDPPPILYVRGEIGSVRERTIAIVGSRAATSYGRSVAANLSGDFCAFGACVVSGLARGIDASAHQGALASGGTTAAVIGSGLCALYPPYHSLVADDIVAGGGAVLSEFPPTMQARSHHFPMRNRIVAALACATVVIEAGARSGALITARLADELGRPVFAVPGDIRRPTSAGTNALIKDGVPLVDCVADVAQPLGWLTTRSRTGDEIASDPLLAALDVDGTDAETLAARTGSGVASVIARLTMLEIRGQVERRPGGLYAAVTARRAAKAGVG
jgi:DNA processing protein